MGIHYLKMRIGFDLRPFLKEETGIGVYFKKLLFMLAKLDQSNEYFLFSSSMKDRFDPRKIPFFAKSKFLDLRFPVKAVNFLWFRLGWPNLDAFFRTRLDLTHSPTPLSLPTKGKKIVTVHDLFFLDFPEMADKRAWRIDSRRIRKSLHRADGIIAVSHYTEQQLLERFGLDRGKIRIIHHGINLKEWETDERESLERIKKALALPSDFLLFVGAHEPRKNLPLLLKALRIVHDRYQKIALVIVGRKGLDSENVQKDIRGLELDSWVKMVSYVDESELRHIYHLGSVFVFPSLSEGFGIPLLEAMACGLPIVTSRSSALPEIAQDAALYIDPHDPEDLATEIIHVLKDKTLKEKLVSAGKKRVRSFSWEKAATETLAFYEDIYQRSRHCS
jgi:glycosyltransferase involved in cell wall biosynthesis